MHGDGSITDEGLTGPPRWARPFVYGFLALFLACACAGFAGGGPLRDFEPRAWPLSGWRLFSGSRDDTSVSHEAFTVDQQGTERPLDFSLLGPGSEEYERVLPHLAGLPDDQRDEMCRTWSEGAAEDRPTVALVRIYRVTRSVPRQPDAEAEVVRRRLGWECGRR